MDQQLELEKELERRLTAIETEEAADRAHAALSGKSLGVFLAVVAGIAILAWFGGTL